MTRIQELTDKEKELRKKLRQLHIFEKDIKETFILASGPGGQNVNKVATCVVIKHIPSGIQIKCQEGRTQRQNRQKARYLLLKKIEERIHLKKLKETQSREKIRRQKRKRPRRLKEQILEGKHRQSDKKQRRQKININKIKDM